MPSVIRYALVAALLLIPAGVYAQVDLYPPAGHVHPVPEEDRVPLPEGDLEELRFKGYRGEACPYHVKVSTKTYVEDIKLEEKSGEESRYSVRLDVKNDSPCLFADIYLHMRLTDLEGEVVNESDLLLKYIPSYSSNIFYGSVWLPNYVDPDEVKFEFDYVQSWE